MPEHDFLLEVVIFLAAAVVFVLLSRRLRANPIIGYLAAGILIGPHGVELVGNAETTRGLAELGIAFLLFSIGLELSWKRLGVLRAQIFGLGSAQFLVSGLAIGAVAVALGASVEAAVIVGGGLALSSTAIVLQLLSERGEIASRMGRVTFSILLLQDLAVVPLLAIVPLLGAGAATDWADLGRAAATGIVAVLAMAVAGRVALRPLLHAIAATRGPEVFVAVTLLVVLGTGWAAEKIGLSLSLGAFLAGLLLAETEFRHQVEADIKPFRSLLLGLFFMTIGMTIDLGMALAHWSLVGGLVVTLLVGKAAILFGLCRLFGLPGMLSLRVGLLLSQGGEFAFILIGGATAAQVLPPTIGQICLMVVGLTMALTPLLAHLGKRLSEHFERQSVIGLAALEVENLDLEGHVIVAGFGRMGQVLARLLDGRRIPYVALDTDPAVVREMRAKGFPVYYGDTSRPELLWGVGADRARAAVVVVGDDEAAIRTVRLLRAKLPDLSILARVRDRSRMKMLTDAGASVIVPETLEASLQLGRRLLRDLGMPEEDVVGAIDALRSDSGGSAGLGAERPGSGENGVDAGHDETAGGV